MLSEQKTAHHVAYNSSIKHMHAQLVYYDKKKAKPCPLPYQKQLVVETEKYVGDFMDSLLGEIAHQLRSYDLVTLRGENWQVKFAALLMDCL